ncbi:MAG: hypothetical protein DRI69_08605 [Bacteroidetes bacterium]|nr:MAG: hypothetical protein DRI69_08605 [Bacteroidota bacterium]
MVYIAMIYFMKTLHIATYLAVVVLAGHVTSCKQGFEARYGPFFIENDTTVYMDGGTGSRIDIQFEKLIRDYPDIKLVVFGNCPGSSDDVSLFEAATLLRNKGIDTHLTPASIIESGAVDFFLAGNNRTREPGSLIGVHAWSEGTKSATDYPVGHSAHQLYIDFYAFCGFTVEEAEAFYFFTINAASSRDLHYMTDEEIEEYQMITE